MATLKRFSTPGKVRDAKPGAWSESVKGLVAAFDQQFPQFYDQSATNTPDDIDRSAVVWSAFPASLRGTPAQRLKTADGDRNRMDEYCEWAVERNRGGKITRVTFTTEVPEYFGHLFETDRDRLLEIYQKFVSPKAKAADLERNRRYLPSNKWNSAPTGRPAHLIQATNTLGAAVRLAAEATILRRDSDGPVTSKQRLVECGGSASRRATATPRSLRRSTTRPGRAPRSRLQTRSGCTSTD